LTYRLLTFYCHVTAVAFCVTRTTVSSCTLPDYLPYVSRYAPPPCNAPCSLRYAFGSVHPFYPRSPFTYAIPFVYVRVSLLRFRTLHLRYLPRSEPRCCRLHPRLLPRLTSPLPFAVLITLLRLPFAAVVVVAVTVTVLPGLLPFCYAPRCFVWFSRFRLPSYVTAFIYRLLITRSATAFYCLLLPFSITVYVP